jgi:hypothetical protein
VVSPSLEIEDIPAPKFQLEIATRTGSSDVSFMLRCTTRFDRNLHIKFTADVRIGGQVMHFPTDPKVWFTPCLNPRLLRVSPIAAALCSWSGPAVFVLTIIPPTSQALPPPPPAGQAPRTASANCERVPFVGLSNPSRLCYVISIVQSLFHVPRFVALVARYRVGPGQEPKQSSLVNLQLLFMFLHKAELPFPVGHLFHSFRWPQSAVSIEHDAFELFGALLHKILGLCRHQSFSGDLEKLFAIDKVERIRYPEIGTSVPMPDEPPWHFHFVEIGYPDLLSSLRGDSTQPISSRDVPGFGVQSAFKETKFRSLGPLLVFSLKRFEASRRCKRFEFPEVLNMTEFMDSPPDSDLMYQLYAVLTHVESGPGSKRFRHYYLFARPALGDQWYEFNDERVLRVTREKAVEGTFGTDHPDGPCAYGLFYVRTSLKDEIFGPVPDDVWSEDVRRLYDAQIEIERRNAREKSYILVSVFSDRHFTSSVRLLAATTQEFSFPRDKSFAELQTMCAGIVGCAGNQAQLWRAAKGVPSVRHTQVEESLSDRMCAFLSLYVRACETWHPDSILVFVKSYARGTVTFVGSRQVRANEQVATIAQFEGNVLAFHEEFAGSTPVRIRSVALSLTFGQIAQGRQAVILTFQSDRGDVLDIVNEPGVVNSSEFNADERKDTFLNWIEENSKVKLQVVSIAEQDATPIVLRVREQSSLSEIKKLIAAVFHLQYDPAHDAMSLQVLDRARGTAAELDTYWSPRDHNTCLLGFLLLPGTSEEQLPWIRKMTVYVYFDFWKLQHKIVMRRVDNESREGFISRLTSQRPLPSRINVYNMFSTLLEFVGEGHLIKSDHVKVDVVPDEFIDVSPDRVKFAKVCQMSILSGGESRPIGQPFFIPLYPGEPFAEFRARLAKCMQVPEEDGVEVMYRYKTQTQSPLFDESCAPWDVVRDGVHIIVEMVYPTRAAVEHVVVIPGGEQTGPRIAAARFRQELTIGGDY